VKSASSGMISHIAQETTTLATCLKITRKDGEVFAYTTCDQDLVISNDDSPETFTTYQANGSYVPSASKADNQFGVPNEEITGAILATDITYDDLVAGKFNGALVQKFLVNWADLSQGKILLPGYQLGTITPEDNHFRTELRGMVDILRARTGDVYTGYCRTDLFSPECGLQQAEFVQSGTVVSTDGRKTMVISGVSDSIHQLVTENLLVTPKSSPWIFDGGINSAYDFGNHGGTAPLTTITPLTEGWKVGVYYTDGTVKISDSERPYVDAAGQRDDISGDTLGSTGDYFPTHYIAGSQLGKGGLIFTFADDDGNVIPGGVETLGPLDGTVSSLVKDTGLLNLSTGFIQDGRRGNTGGGDTTVIGTMTPGTPAIFHVEGIDPFDNAYWYIKYHNLTEPNYFVQHIKMRLNGSANRAAARAIEIECQLVRDHLMFNMAWQADFADGGKWRTFSKTDHAWHDSGITFDPTIFDGNAWVELEAIFQLTASTVTHVSLSINGTVNTVNITRPAVVTTDHDYTSTAFQLDEDGNTPPTPYDCEVEDWSVKMYSGSGSGLSWVGEVPAGATRMQFGINDDNLDDNRGTGFNIQVQIDKGKNSGTANLSDYDQGGRIEFTSGDLDGYTAEIKVGDTGTGEIQLYLATPLAIAPGNTFNIWPSCDKSPATCLNKFKNIINFRGFKYLPGVDAARVTQLVKLP
jgi:hypothetical protein